VQIKVSASTARSIIALSSEGLRADSADSRMVRQILSLQVLRGYLLSFYVQMPHGHRLLLEFRHSMILSLMIRSSNVSSALNPPNRT
jgi:hypothetical protein